MYGEVALVFRLVGAVVAFKHLRRTPVFSFHVTLEVDLPLEDLATVGAHLDRGTVFTGVVLTTAAPSTGLSTAADDAADFTTSVRHVRTRVRVRSPRQFTPPVHHHVRTPVEVLPPQVRGVERERIE